MAGHGKGNRSMVGDRQNKGSWFRKEGMGCYEGGKEESERGDAQFGGRCMVLGWAHAAAPHERVEKRELWCFGVLGTPTLELKRRKKGAKKILGA